MLPPLLYAAGEEMPWRELRQVWRPVTVLAVGLVLFTAAAVGFLATAVAPLTASMGFVLGAVLASTDPVAVAALGRRLSLPTRLQVLVQAESLFNDATSLVLFRVAVAAAVAGGAIAPGPALGEFALLAVGGTLIGVVVSGGVAVVRKRTEDPVLESVIALVTPYAAFVLAETVHASGVTAVIVAAILLGQQSAKLTTAHIRLQLAAVNATVIFILESVVFSLIGLQLPTLIRSLAGADTAWLLPSLVIAAALIATRVLWVFPLSAIVQWRSGARPSWQAPAVVSWAGARGVVPLAAALSIPLTAVDGTPLPDRDLRTVQVLATVVIVISLVVQGFTLEPLVRRAGIALQPAIGAKEDTFARLKLAEASLDHLEQLEDAEGGSPIVIERARRNLLARRDRIRTTLDGDEPHDSLAPVSPPAAARPARGGAGRAAPALTTPEPSATRPDGGWSASSTSRTPPSARTEPLSPVPGRVRQALLMDTLVPERLCTARLQLRRPATPDAAEILTRYAGDPEVTRFVAWPRHRSVADSLAFVVWSDDVWSTQGAGPYLVLDESGRLVGSTGLDLETREQASTGYVLARDAWGLGYATELASEMVRLADVAGLHRLYALCHPANRASARVLEKAGLRFEGILPRHAAFPQLETGQPADVECWARTRESAGTLNPCSPVGSDGRRDDRHRAPGRRPGRCGRVLR